MNDPAAVQTAPSPVSRVPGKLWRWLGLALLVVAGIGGFRWYQDLLNPIERELVGVWSNESTTFVLMPDRTTIVSSSPTPGSRVVRNRWSATALNLNLDIAIDDPQQRSIVERIIFLINPSSGKLTVSYQIQRPDRDTLDLSMTGFPKQSAHLTRNPALLPAWEAFARNVEHE